MERKHNSWNVPQQYDDENSEYESEDENQESSSESESGDSQDSDQSEPQDNYSFDDVQAILRYFLQADES